MLGQVREAVLEEERCREEGPGPALQTEDQEAADEEEVMSLCKCGRPTTKNGKKYHKRCHVCHYVERDRRRMANWYGHGKPYVHKEAAR